MTVAEAKRDQHRALLEIRLLEGEGRAVVEADDRDAHVLDRLARDFPAREAKWRQVVHADFPASRALRRESQLGVGERRRRCPRRDRESVVYGKSVSVRVDFGGRRLIKTKKRVHNTVHNTIT